MTSLTLFTWSLIIGHLWLHPIAEGGERPPLYKRERESLHLASSAVKDLLRASTKHWCTVALVMDGLTSSAAVKRLILETYPPFGIRIFGTTMQEENVNKTLGRLSQFIKEVTALRKTHECLTVVVGSDSLLFLETFASAYEFDLLLVWDQRPVIITNLSLVQLSGLLSRQWLLFAGFAMVVNVPADFSQTLLLSIYAHLPYSPDEGGQMVKVANWSPYLGLVSADQRDLFPAKSKEFTTGQRVSVKEALKEPKALGWILQDPRTFRFESPVRATLACEQWTTVVIFRRIGETDTYEFDGPMASLVNAFAQSLNFTYKLEPPEDGQWGSMNDDGSWTGLVGQVHRQEADFAVGPHDTTEQRSKYIEYAIPLWFDTRRFVVAQNLAKIDPWGFMFPLSPLVWIGVLSALGLVALMMVVVGRNYKGDPLLVFACDVVFHTYRLLLQQGLKMKFKKPSEVLLVVVWLGVAMVICYSYSTNLISLLAVRYAPRPIQTIQDLLDHDSMTVIFPKRTSLTDYLFSVESGQLKEVADLNKIGRYKGVPYWEFRQALENLVRHGDHILATDTLDSTRMIADYFSKTGRCQFYLAKEEFVPLTQAMVFQKGSPLAEAISHRIQRILEGGLFRYWLDKHLPNSTSCRHMPSTFTVREPLALTNIWGLFVILASGLALAAVTLCFEVLFAKLF